MFPVYYGPRPTVGGDWRGRAGDIAFLDYLMICIYKVQKMEATFKGNLKSIVYPKGWEPTFLIGAFGLSEEPSTEVGFAFSNNCLKSQDLRFGMKNNCMVFLIMFHDFRFGLGIVTAHLTYLCLFTQQIELLSKHYTMLTQLLSFSMWKRHLRLWYVKCVVTISRQNLKP